MVRCYHSWVISKQASCFLQGLRLHRGTQDAQEDGLHAISSFSDRTFASAELRLCCQILNESDAEGLCLGAFPYPFLPCNIQQSKGYQHDGSGTH